MTENTQVILKQKRAEGYIDVAVTVMIVAFVLIFAVNLVSLVALHQNVKTIADQLTEYASICEKRPGLTLPIPLQAAQPWIPPGRYSSGRGLCVLSGSKAP